jgi:chromate transport protein ChrA
MGVMAVLRQRRLPYKTPYLYGLAASVAFMLIYTFRTVGYGGYSYGVRWFVAPMFILCLPLSHVMNQVRSSRLLKKFFVVIACMSIAISLVGTYTPYPNDSTGKLSLGGSYVSGYTFLINANNIANHSSVLYKISFTVSAVAIYFMFNRLLKRLKQTPNIPPDDNVV